MELQDTLAMIQLDLTSQILAHLLMLPCRRLAMGKVKECLTVREFLGHRIGGGTCLRAVITRERDEDQQTAIRPPCLSRAVHREGKDLTP